MAACLRKPTSASPAPGPAGRVSRWPTQSRHHDAWGLSQRNPRTSPRALRPEGSAQFVSAQIMASVVRSTLPPLPGSSAPAGAHRRPAGTRIPRTGSTTNLTPAQRQALPPPARTPYSCPEHSGSVALSADATLGMHHLTVLLALPRAPAACVRLRSSRGGPARCTRALCVGSTSGRRAGAKVAVLRIVTTRAAAVNGQLAVRGDRSCGHSRRARRSRPSGHDRT